MAVAVTAKDDEFDDPPSYNEVEGSEFEPYTKLRKLSVGSLTSAPQPPPAPNNRPDSKTFHTDVFQTPPKFLLHSTEQENRSAEVNTREIGNTVPQFLIPTDESVKAHCSSSVFSVTPGHPPQNSSGIPPPPRSSLMFDDHMPRHSQRILCPYCRTGVQTRIEYVNGTMTHLAAIAACWFTCCFCIPYFIKDLKDVEHFCPDCDKILGWNRKMDWYF